MEVLIDKRTDDKELRNEEARGIPVVSVRLLPNVYTHFYPPLDFLGPSRRY